MIVPVRFYLYGAVIVLFGAWYVYMHHHVFEQGAASGKAEVMAVKAGYAQATANAQAHARMMEQAQAAQLLDISAKYQEAQKDAQAKGDRVVADLRSARIQLQDRWSCPSVSGPTASGPVVDDLTVERDKSAGRIIETGAKADATIRALQNVVRSDRGLPPVH